MLCFTFRKCKHNQI